MAAAQLRLVAPAPPVQQVDRGDAAWIGRDRRRGERAGLGANPSGVRFVEPSDSTRFKVGDEVLLFRDGAEYGVPVVIEKPYGPKWVKEEFGEYVTSDGSRATWRPGYSVRAKDGRGGFVCAALLTRNDCKPAHLRRVV